MSSKTPSPGKADPRIPPKEAPVTRHKSAQMKRQLRAKDRSMKHITDLLKSPTRDQAPTKNVTVKKKQTSPKAKQSLLKSVEKIQNLPQKTFKLSKVLRKKVQLIEDEEYYPSKRKRKLAVNKVVLKAKPKLKVVGEMTGSVKRKYSIPLKVSDNPTPTPVQPSRDPPSPEAPEPARLTMAEAIHIMDEHLTDEDMMEILTCPSPVWWEDPPDERYIEDALFTRTPSKKKDDTPPKSGSKESPMEVDPTKSDTDSIIVIPNLSAKSDKFLKKRSKLEDLLGNIKDKSNTKQSNEKNTDKKDDVCSNEVKSKEIKDDAAKSDKLEAKMSESDDEIMFHNTSMNEDELLKDLENMDIPIAIENQDDVIIIDDDDDFLDKPENKEADKEVVTEENKNAGDQETTCDDTKKADEITAVSDTKMELVNEENKNSDDRETICDDTDKADEITAVSDTKTEPVNEEYKNSDDQETICDDTNQADEIAAVNDSNDAEVPKNLPALQKCNSSREISSPKSSDSLSSKSSVTSMSSKDIDTISDTNVRFLLDDEIDDQNKVTNNRMDAENGESANENSENRDSAKDGENSVTVYKIIEEISDTSTDIKESRVNSNEMEKPKSKLHEAYKNCIKMYQKRIKSAKKDTDINKNEVSQEDYTSKFCEHCKPNFKKVSDDENVKYCLNCSSIFDSNDCTYCMNKSTKSFICVPCKYKFCCYTFQKMHEINCHKTCREELKIADKCDIEVFGRSFKLS